MTTNPAAASTHPRDALRVPSSGGKPCGRGKPQHFDTQSGGEWILKPTI